MVLFKVLAFLAFVAMATSSPLFGKMEHHVFGIPLPHTNNPIAHNLENMLTHGLEDITGIHSRGNDKPMDMGGMDMGGGSSMGGMDMGGSGGGVGGIFGDVGTLLGLGGGHKPATPVRPNINTSRVTASSGSNVDQKQLLQYLKLLQAQQKDSSSNPSSDEILKYMIRNTKPVTEKTVIENGNGGNSDLQQKLAALLAAQEQR